VFGAVAEANMRPQPGPKERRTYWTMGAPVKETSLINRRKAD